MSKQYRFYNGHIEVQWEDGQWAVSAHDKASVNEVGEYEKAKHSAAKALREKYQAVLKATAMSNGKEMEQ